MLKDCSKQQTVSWLLYKIFLSIYIFLCQLLCSLKYHCVIIVLCVLTNLYSTNSISFFENLWNDIAHHSTKLHKKMEAAY